MGILGKKPITRMDCLGPSAPRGVEHLAGIEVALPRRGWPQPHRFVGLKSVPRADVGVAVDGDGLDAQPPQSPDHPHRDLTAVGHQHRLEHRTHIRNTP